MKEKLNVIVVGENLQGVVATTSKKNLINFIVIDDDSSIMKALDENRIVDAIVTTGDINKYKILQNASFEIRKKWYHYDNPTINEIESSAIATFMGNNGRENGVDKIFSIFTCAYKTNKLKAERLYKSLVNQTYKNWNWWIIDDSPEGEESYFSSIKDPRITIIKNVTNHGSIGFNKHMIAMMCDGDYLVEVDHDDALTEDCLLLLYNAFEEYPDSKFVYSDTLEMVGDHTSVCYSEGFSYGQGYYRNENVEGWNYKVAITCPSINARSIRGIHAQPNHVRVWERNFYHFIGGHNIDLGVCDDMDILVRTFLNTKMTHINKVLYIQYEDSVRSERADNTQGRRFKVIQELNELLRQKYDKKIHERILELGYEDNAWIEDGGYSDLHSDNFEPIDYGYQA